MSKERQRLLLGRPYRSIFAVLAILSLIIGAVLVRDASPASARIFFLSIVDRTSPNFNDGDFDLADAQTFPLGLSDGTPGNVGSQFDTFFAPIGSTVWIGVATENGAGPVTADSAGYGSFTQALCNDNNGDLQDFQDPGDACNNMTGVGTPHMVIADVGNSLEHQPPALLPRMGLGIAFKCGATPGTAHIVIVQSNSIFDFFMVCHAPLARGTIVATKTQLEIDPQHGSTAHSLLLLSLTDANGGIVAGYEVEWQVDRCAIETDDVDTVDEALQVLIGAVGVDNSVGPDVASPQADIARNLVFDFNGDGRLESISLAVLHCEAGHSATNTAGPIHVIARVTKTGEPAQVFTILLNVLGPPDKIFLSASPTRVQCGEKTTVSAVVVDALGQTVSDNTPVEFVVNLGGTGTAAAARLLGPVAPISSGVGFTTNGIATFFTLTSTVNVGNYDIVAHAKGFPDKPPIVATTSITCFVPASPTPAPAAVVPATVAAAAPSASTAVRPPNTGDGGLLR